MPREEAERNHRERLFAAMVASVVEKGYEATRVADLVELSGISRSAFYRQFADKKECFLAAAEELIQPTVTVMERAEHASSGEERMREAVRAFLKLIVSQPAAARMCFVEIYAAGPEAVTLIDRALDTFEEFGIAQFEQIPGREGMPLEMMRAMMGGLQKVVHKRLYRDEQDALMELATQICDWWLSYPPPLSATVAEIVDRASTSQRTFYENFANKEEALLAALDTGSAQMLANTLPAFRRAQDWQNAVRMAYEEMFSFGFEEPEYTRLGAVEMYAAGKRALETRDTIMEGLEALLAPGYELAPDTPESLPELVPMATYMTLAPFLGAAEAYELALYG